MRKTFVRLLSLSIFLSGVFAVLHQICPWRIGGPESEVWESISEIQSLRLGVQLFRLDRNRYPDTVDEYLEAYPPASPNAITDNYGKRYHLRLVDSDLGVIVYSAGPNGIDEGGYGDDIVGTGDEVEKVYRCPEFFPCPTVCENVSHIVMVVGLFTWTMTALYLIYATLLLVIQKLFPAS